MRPVFMPEPLRSCGLFRGRCLEPEGRFARGDAGRPLIHSGYGFRISKSSSHSENDAMRSIASPRRNEWAPRPPDGAEGSHSWGLVETHRNLLSWDPGLRRDDGEAAGRGGDLR